MGNLWLNIRFGKLHVQVERGEGLRFLVNHYHSWTGVPFVQVYNAPWKK